MIKNRNTMLCNLMLVSQLGFSIMAPIFLCIFIGYFLDSRFGTRSLILLIFLGFLAGGRNGWLQIRRFAEISSEMDDRSNKYQVKEEQDDDLDEEIK